MNADITLSQVEDVLKNLNKKHKSPAIDRLPYEILKNGRLAIARHLCDLFNGIPVTGIYPDMWCEAIISININKTYKLSQQLKRNIIISYAW